MDYFLERKVKINRNTESKNFYTWCLNEFDENDKQIGPDWEPFRQSLSFTLASLQVTTDLHIDNLTDGKSPQIISNLIDQSKSSSYKSIQGKFYSGSLDDNGHLINKDQFSILGTARTIKEFHVVIMQLRDESAETCFLIVNPSYESEGFDFRKIIEKDIAAFEVYLAEAKFNKLAKLIEDRSIDSATLSVRNVEGVYAPHYPTISNHYEIKFLTSKDVVQGLENTNFEGTATQRVGNFSIKLTTSFSSIFNYEFESNKYSKQLESECDENLEKTNSLKISSESIAIYLQPLLKAIENIKFVIWFVFVALIFLLFK